MLTLIRKGSAMIDIHRPSGKQIRLPWVISACSLFAILLFVIPGASEAFQLNRAAVLSGSRLWTLITAHFTHWNFSHLVWDLLMFAVLGCIAEKYHPTKTIALLSVASLAISSAVLAAHPELNSYRGLSGLDSALFVFLVTGWLRESVRAGDKQQTAGCAVLLLLFSAKAIYEVVTTTTLFASDFGYKVIPLAHLVGGASGIVFVFFKPLPLLPQGVCPSASDAHATRTGLGPRRNRKNTFP
jgi:rhomboid family GlyGly-CTERM serine protease